MSEDADTPISYMVLEGGTAVYTSDGAQLGEVKRVLADFDNDIFDGLIIHIDDGDRFVDAPTVGELYEHRVELKLTSDEATQLPDPTANPAVMEPTPDDIAGDTPGDTLSFRLQQVWNRISGKY
jgi:sporulation protein YlmC with PRC-barrel domain